MWWKEVFYGRLLKGEVDRERYEERKRKKVVLEVKAMGFCVSQIKLSGGAATKKIF
jgi:hypothetical protein